MADSLIDAILMEPERFLSYIKNWDKIFTLRDFIKAFAKAFLTHDTGKNVYGSSEIKDAIELLWNNNISQTKVEKNYKKINT